jgi:hypothetical protein
MKLDAKPAPKGERADADFRPAACGERMPAPAKAPSAPPGSAMADAFAKLRSGR